MPIRADSFFHDSKDFTGNDGVFTTFHHGKSCRGLRFSKSCTLFGNHAARFSLWCSRPIAAIRSPPTTKLQLANRNDGSGMIGFVLFDLGAMGLNSSPPANVAATNPKHDSNRFIGWRTNGSLGPAAR
jgi:hypothetical protein